jgi:gas vesicle protein
MKNQRSNLPEVREQPPSFFNGLMIGLVAGAAGYFLFGTKKGQGVRKTLMKQAEKGWAELEDTVDKAEKTGKKLTKDVKKLHQKVSREAQKTQVRAQEELQQLQEKAQAAQKRADEIQDRLKKTAANIEKRFFTRNGQSLGK